MQIYKTIAEIREALAGKALQKKIGFVPTMGALHKGHLSLVERCHSESDLTVVSIYVNPTQFGPQEDLNHYPRNLEKDIDLLRNYHVDIVFTPDDVQMYPEGYCTWVQVEGLSDILCGASRPGHFRGVATIVLKLMHIVNPKLMFMGMKDYQQIIVLEKMIEDLNLETKIVRCPIVREPDGLAMSSRNSYLTPDERQRATCLIKALKNAQQMVNEGYLDSSILISEAENIIKQSDGRIDYIKIVDGSTLQELPEVRSGSRMMLAVYIGNTRLIDNIELLP
ncbi:MAG TPA: pantoate--beta-alanine ligase [Candidatus Syntrophosphaera thermopropionivorans]|nr:pantoate--beta-alanine ligase [Candidatus Syntrophosphaera thermopropionivorans]HOL33567.1 pantoate--beta-alanine ligase [Candidatus Syntrophosphaera thermopropionivorans]HPQ30792.1 pantoate--beta-alanine ligase [Candidatus Syntrophosphaera thermopropionivorans]HQH47657.1 pantoate--beta-alanine ligase [Candidatus Syntrophosphaera thermopropionivorans]HQK57590.1 pantoate--beta-alanine ligase [Candidatus Syntrophosphaera thermopropionivorans]